MLRTFWAACTRTHPTQPVLSPSARLQAPFRYHGAMAKMPGTVLQLADRPACWQQADRQVQPQVSEPPATVLSRRPAASAGGTEHYARFSREGAGGAGSRKRGRRPRLGDFVKGPMALLVLRARPRGLGKAEGAEAMTTAHRRQIDQRGHEPHGLASEETRAVEGPDSP